MTPSKLEIRNFLTLSTAHITEETAKWLDETVMANAGTLAFTPWHEYGWWFYADEHPDPLWPEELRNLMAFSRKHGCYYFLLDCDADTTDELPTFDW